jgi:hypothetical protein
MFYIQEINQILSQARQKTYQAINTAMIEAYWNIGRNIVEEEQNGKERADYRRELANEIERQKLLLKLK